MTDAHPPTTATAHHEILQQGASLARGAVPFGSEVVEVVLQRSPIQQTLVIADIGRVDVRDDDVSRVHGKASRRHDRRIPRADLLLAAYVDKDPGVHRTDLPPIARLSRTLRGLRCQEHPAAQEIEAGSS
ncbi:hypothetical protein DC522_28730, partial [Microvirga sp. KLBC 81]|uniref:hypothetical protein n=1 Tax=Microvirga sp. KLBC 81 TaxID=1862707 RepID=UPI000D515ACD